LNQVLYDKYGFKRGPSDEISRFVNEVIRVDPEDRKRASDLIDHEWVRVDGENDIEME
jgi:hypothetical protein